MTECRVLAEFGTTASCHKNYNRYLLNVRSAPYATLHNQEMVEAAPTGTASIDGLQFHPFRDLQGIIDFNPKIANGTFQLGMSEQKLNGP